LEITEQFKNNPKYSTLLNMVPDLANDPAEMLAQLEKAAANHQTTMEKIGGLEKPSSEDDVEKESSDDEKEGSDDEKERSDGESSED
jgi:hypothetical protein